MIRLQFRVLRYNVAQNIMIGLFKFVKYTKYSSLIHVRSYSFKPLHNFKEIETINYAIFEYAKSSSGLKSDYGDLHVSNVLSRDQIIDKLHPIITYTPRPQTKDVILLFDTYANSTRSLLRKYFTSKGNLSNMQFKIVASLKEMNIEELHQLSMSLRKLAKKSHDANTFKSVYHELSAECLDRSYDSSLKESLKMFLITYELYGHAFKVKPVYDEFISVFKKELDNADPLELIQILLFLSIAKKKWKHDDIVDNSLTMLIPSIKELPFICVGIMCHSYYRIGPKEAAILDFMKDICFSLKQFMNNIDKEISLLEANAMISIIKILRFYRHFDNEIISCVKDFILKTPEDALSPEMICHLIAYYSNFNYYDRALFLRCEKLLYNRISSAGQNVRIKDASRAIWAFSQVLHCCSQDFYLSVVKALEEFSYTAEFRFQGQHFVDCALGLTIMGYHPDLLIRKIVNKSLFNNLKEHQHSRKLSRFLLLFEASKDRLHLEAPWLEVPRNLVPYRSIKDEITHRPAVSRINKTLEWLTSEFGGQFCPFELQFLVPYINSCSLVIKDLTNEHLQGLSKPNLLILSRLNEVKSKSLFEIEDEFSCLVNEPDKLIGREYLKRTILLNGGWKIYPLSEKQINLCGDDPQALFALLLKKISSEESWSLQKS